MTGNGTILLEEDDPDVRALIRNFLSDLPFDVIEASRASDASGIVRSEQPLDLAIVDFWLETGTAVTLLDEVRRSLDGVPIILISGGGGSGIDLEVTQAIGDASGALAFLPKPFSKAMLLEAVRSVTSRHGTIDRN